MLLHVLCPLFCPRICRLINRDDEKEKEKDGKSCELEDSLDEFDASRILDRALEHINASAEHQIASVPVDVQPHVSIEEPLVQNTSYRLQIASNPAASGDRNSRKAVAQMREPRSKKYSFTPRIAEGYNLISYTWTFLCCSPLTCTYFRYWLRCVRLFYCSPRTIFTANVVRSAGLL